MRTYSLCACMYNCSCAHISIMCARNTITCARDTNTYTCVQLLFINERNTRTVVDLTLDLYRPKGVILSHGLWLAVITTLIFCRFFYFIFFIVHCLFAGGLLIKDIASVVRQRGYQLSDCHLRRLLVKLGLRRRCFGSLHAEHHRFFNNTVDKTQPWKT